MGRLVELVFTTNVKMPLPALLPLVCRAPLSVGGSRHAPHPSPQEFLSVAILHQNSRNGASPLSLRHRLLSPVVACGSDSVDSTRQKTAAVNNEKLEWDSLTSKFAGAANIPFLVLQMPQIILNASNLIAGNTNALLAVPWLAMFTGLLGNLSLLSYFAKKRETEAMAVQTLGIVSMYVVFTQLAMAKAMPLELFIATSVGIVIGLFFNFLNYFGKLNVLLWHFWEDAITICGMTALPQVMWSTFVPYVPQSMLPGLISGILAMLSVVMARSGNLSEKGIKFVGAISGWTATLLFMWMPIPQMWTNFLNPDNIKGLSSISMLLAMIGNGLMLPRALFIRDFMWFTGSSWGTLLYGYGNIVCMFCFNSISKVFFLSSTVVLITWLGVTLWRDTLAYGYTSPFRFLKELLFGF